MKSGAQILIEMMKGHGVSTVSGIPGGAILPVYDELSKSGIRHILARHEQGAAFIAQGMARSTGKPAITIATSGPGASNLITAIADAKLDCVPLIAITGQVSRSLLGKDSFQEIDIVAITSTITKKSFFAASAAELPEIFAQAWQLSIEGKPGPVLIDIPKDVQTELTDITFDPFPREKRKKAPHIDEIEAAARLIIESKRPVIIAGGGINTSGAHDLLADFAAACGIPVASTLMGLGTFDMDSPIYAGFAGMHGYVHTNVFIDEADLIIALGSRFNDRATGKADEFAKKAKIIHIDSDETELGKIIPGTLLVHAEIPEFLKRITPLVGTHCRFEWKNRLTQLKQEHPIRSYPPQHPASIIDAINETVAENAIILTDVGQHQMWTAQRFTFTPQRPLLTSGGLGTMGFGLPAAIGAAIAHPGREIVLISGDGSIMMNLQELALIRELMLNIRIFIINNSRLGLVRQQQELFYNENYFACAYEQKHDIAAIANAFGIPSFSAEGQDAAQMFSQLPTGTSCLLDIAAGETECVFPMVPPGKSNREMIGGAA